MTPPAEVLRAALEEQIRMGPATRVPAAKRLAARLPAYSAEVQAEGMREAGRAIGLAEALARDYQAGNKTQTEVEAELRRQFPWLAVPEGAGGMDLAAHLGHYGYFLVIM